MAVLMRVDLYDEVTAVRGLRTVQAQAALHGIHRSTMFRIRSGARTPSLELALRIAGDLGVQVELLFRRVSDQEAPAARDSAEAVT